ncbi:NUDT9 [Mytilus edulis]|uniref:NUDT9 n=1 Tax=Mytilus edulis TaxID=6550 RepID=A0A8S3S727_MYTED|nr:NUDT9 [Mytilus edulis]
MIIYRYEVQLDSDSSGHVNGHIDYIHQWSSIHGSWSFIDPESPIVDYKWAIGYTQGGTQIQTFKCEGRRKFGLNNKVNLVDKTFVYITVIATNAAGLQTIAYSDPVLVDLTPPIFDYVYDGTGADQDAWEVNIVSANWEVADAESGIDFCQYAFGYQPGGSDLHPWTTTTVKSVSMEFDYSDLEGLTVYTSVKCYNTMGLGNTTSSDGVRISNKSPSITSAVVSPFYLSSSEYISKDGFQSVTDVVRLKWQGFTDSIGIDNYLITFEGSQTKKEKVSFPIQQDLFFTYFYNLQLTESHQTVHVQAINVLYKKSDKVSRNMTVLLTPPVRDNSKQVIIEWLDNKFNILWENVFSSSETLWYEISAGTFRGGSNIVQWLETTNQNIEFGMPSSITEPAGIYVFVLGVLWLSVSIVVLSVYVLVVDVYLNGNRMIGFSNGVRRLSIKIGQTKPSKMTFGGGLHCKARCQIYPRTKDVKRFTVPDDKVRWNVPFPEYSPPSFTTETVLSGPYYADPDICSGKGEITKWNEIDGKVSRVSFEGKYEVVDGLPLNPVGRTGIKHRGCLGRWGPNHAADPIVTRWKRTEDDEIVKGEDGKQVMEFVSIQRRDNREWAIPGGMVEPGSLVSATIKQEFGEEAMNSLEMSEEEKKEMHDKIEDFLSHGDKVYEGYVDDLETQTMPGWKLQHIISMTMMELK